MPFDRRAGEAEASPKQAGTRRPHAAFPTLAQTEEPSLQRATSTRDDQVKRVDKETDEEDPPAPGESHGPPAGATHVPTPTVRAHPSIEQEEHLAAPEQ